MKKFFVLYLLSFFSLSVFSQNRGDLYKHVVTRLTYPVQTGDESYFTYSDGGLEFHIVPSCDYRCREYSMISVLVSNNTSDKIHVDWDNAHLCGSKIVFSDDRRLFADHKKSPELLYVGESTPFRGLLPRKNVTDYSILPIYTYRSTDEYLADLIIPIVFPGGSKDYKFTISFSKYSEAEVDSLFPLQKEYYRLSRRLKKRMSKEDVLSIMGAPISVACAGDSSSRPSSSSVLHYPFVFVHLGRNETVDMVELRKHP